MFINILGTFGSGKSTVVTTLMQECRARGAIDSSIVRPVARLDGKEKFMGHHYQAIRGLKKGIIFMGKYGQSQCGGADTLNWKGAHEDMEAFIKEHIGNNHILIEGSITSSASRYNRIGTEFKAQNIKAVYLHLSTPREVCIERVLGRRKQRHETKLQKAKDSGKEVADAKEFDRKNLDKLFDVVEKQYEKTLSLGLMTKKIDSSPDAGKYILRLLEIDEMEAQT
jgi:adenylate kinase family enzyme